MSTLIYSIGKCLSFKSTSHILKNVKRGNGNTYYETPCINMFTQ